MTKVIKTIAFWGGMYLFFVGLTSNNTEVSLLPKIIALVCVAYLLGKQLFPEYFKK